MKNLILCLLSVCFFAHPAPAQNRSFDFSTPVDINPIGVNKVLCMKSGSTLLFHFEPGKPVQVKVFDSTHKLVAHTEHFFTVLDINTLKTFDFKGLYDIGGEAVLFVEQQNSGRHSLVRVRINAANGKLIEEKTMDKARGIARPEAFYVMKNKDEEGYAILYSNDVQPFKECYLHVTCYSATHEQVRDVPIVFDRKKYDYMHVASADMLADGVCITLGFSVIEMNGTGHRIENAAIYDHTFGMFFIPNGEDKVRSRLAHVGTDIYPYYATATYNAFAKTNNVLLLSYKEIMIMFGLEPRPSAWMANIFFRLDEENMSGDYALITNKMATATMPPSSDTSRLYQGLPLRMFTNANGLTTLISESFSRYKNIEMRDRPDVYESFFGDIAITQIDDDGKEMWGTVLPRTQYFKSYRHYYSAYELAKRRQDQVLFGDLPPSVYERQFVSVNTYSRGSDVFIVYNDYDKNEAKDIEVPGDTVYTSSNTNACYYKINKKREVTKQYMFGDPLAKEYKAGFIEGADFDEQRGLYATLVQYKRGAYSSLRMAWRRLD